MASYKNLQELLEKSVTWEKQLKDFYDVAEIGLGDGKAKKIVSNLRERQESNIDILGHIDIEKYGPNEWVRFSLDYHENKLIPRKNIKRDSGPKEILDAIADYENKLKNYYQAILDSLQSREQRELFKSLVEFRDKQIEQIESLRRQ